MMRGKPMSSMQKTYDDCYLVCSTAVYFESQNNEAEALRSWRNALDQIYYHNAYRMPTSWRPKTETERALQDSLRQMELQCKERVDLLEALQQTRKDAANASSSSLATAASSYREERNNSSSASALNAPYQNRRNGSSTTILHHQQQQHQDDDAAGHREWLGGGTVPPIDYQQLARPPPLPTRNGATRPSYPSRKSSGTDVPRSKGSPLQSTSATFSSSTLAPPVVIPGNPVGGKSSRTPSPEKKGGMLKTLRAGGKERQSSSKMVTTLRTKPPAAAKAATQAWGTLQRSSFEHANSDSNASGTATPPAVTWDKDTRTLVMERPPSMERGSAPPVPPHAPSNRSSNPTIVPPSPSDYMTRLGPGRRDSSDNYFGDRSRISAHHSTSTSARTPDTAPYPDYPSFNPQQSSYNPMNSDDLAHRDLGPPDPITSPSMVQPSPANNSRLRKQSPARLPKLESLPSYRKEYPTPPPSKYTKPPNARPPKVLRELEATASAAPSSSMSSSAPVIHAKPPPPPIPRKAVGVVSATRARREFDDRIALGRTQSVEDDSVSSGIDAPPRLRRKKKHPVDVEGGGVALSTPPSDKVLRPSDAQSSLSRSSDTDTLDVAKEPTEAEAWDQRVQHLVDNLPKGVDESAAKQILNEIVVKGDQVHWSDVAGLEIAKSALKETVVYPFLRPDLFMGLREPARGMLLFGPPGTGKTMLARAVATESRSTFFAISASSLTSKYLGESEKLVRALFTVAKALAPSIIFVDEIDSLLSSRGGGSEHEASRRIKTEFLIQWSDLAKAAAGRGDVGGDATRVLVLAATNLPWAIDEAARRRFVRRQYIPLPEDWVRKEQLLTLLSAQKHGLSEMDLEILVQRTDGFSGSDITALAKDAAMGPLRSLGEKLLNMSPDDIRPIQYRDFEASLETIRPSVSKAGLKEFEDWAREFGERGG